MNRNATTQVTALGLAALVTLTLLAGIEQLAVAPAHEATLAQQAAPVQVVVVTGQRVPRG